MSPIVLTGLFTLGGVGLGWLGNWLLGRQGAKTAREVWARDRCMDAYVALCAARSELVMLVRGLSGPLETADEATNREVSAKSAAVIDAQARVDIFGSDRGCRAMVQWQRAFRAYLVEVGDRPEGSTAQSREAARLKEEALFEEFRHVARSEVPRVMPPRWETMPAGRSTTDALAEHDIEEQAADR